MVEKPRLFAKRQQGIAKITPEVDGLLTCSALLRQMREGTQCLLKVPHSFAVGRPRQSLLPCLSTVRQGLVPHLPSQGMVGQAFDLLGHPLARLCRRRTQPVPRDCVGGGGSAASV